MSRLTAPKRTRGNSRPAKRNITENFATHDFRRNYFTLLVQLGCIFSVTVKKKCVYPVCFVEGRLPMKTNARTSATLYWFGVGSFLVTVDSSEACTTYSYLFICFVYFVDLFIYFKYLFIYLFIYFVFRTRLTGSDLKSSPCLALCAYICTVHALIFST